MSYIYSIFPSFKRPALINMQLFLFLQHFSQNGIFVHQRLPRRFWIAFYSRGKPLYVKKVKRSGKQIYICYQTILSATKKNEVQCTARASVDENKVCLRNRTPHTNHANHSVIYSDLETLNTIKKKCRYSAENFPLSSHRVSPKEIFYMELSK